MRDDDSIVPFCPSNKQVLAEPDIRRAVYLEFSRLLFEYVTLKDRDDALQTIRQLQATLSWAFRIERRIVIRRALTCSAQDVPEHKAKLEIWGGGPNPSATEDYCAAERHLHQGEDLFAGLRRRGKAVG